MLFLLEFFAPAGFISYQTAQKHPPVLLVERGLNKRVGKLTLSDPLYVV